MNHQHNFPIRIISAAIVVLAAIGVTSSIAIAQDGDLPTPVRAKVDTKPMKSAGASLSPLEVTIWNSPSFQRQFAESYMAETSIEPPVTPEETVVIQEAMGLFAEDQLDAAEQLVRDHLTRNPDASASFYYMLANIKYQQDDMDASEENYQLAIDRHKNFRRAYQNLGLMQIRQQKFEQALGNLTRTIELGGATAQMFGLVGICHSAKQHHVAAESAFRMAMILSPTEDEWKRRLAHNFYQQRRYADTIALLEQMIAESPEKTELWMLQANAFLGLNKPLKAAENFEVIERLDGASPESLNILGDIYVNQQAFSLALQAYIKALKINGAKGIDQPLRRASILAARNASSEADSLINSIEEYAGDELTDEQRRSLYRIRAKIAVETGATEDQIAVLKELVRMDPLDGDALILLGDHARANEDFATAAFYYEQAAGIEAFEVNARTRHAEMLVANGQFRDALPLLRAAQDLNPRPEVQKFIEDVERRVR